MEVLSLDSEVPVAVTRERGDWPFTVKVMRNWSITEAMKPNHREAWNPQSKLETFSRNCERMKKVFSSEIWHWAWSSFPSQIWRLKKIGPRWGTKIIPGLKNRSWGSGSPQVREGQEGYASALSRFLWASHVPKTLPSHLKNVFSFKESETLKTGL